MSREQESRDRTRRRHLRDKSVIDHLVGDGSVAPAAPSGGNAHSAETPAGQPVEKQIRKEWEPGEDGGLPTF
jgi:hypothetical protein